MGVQSAGSIAGTDGAWRSRKSRSLPAGGVDLDPVAPGLQHRDQAALAEDVVRVSTPYDQIDRGFERTIRYIRPMDWHDRITIDSAVLTGKPVVKGTRLTVDFIVGLLAQGWQAKDILRNYPGLTQDDIAACLAYASDVLQSERVYPAATA